MRVLTDAQIQQLAEKRLTHALTLESRHWNQEPNWILNGRGLTLVVAAQAVNSEYLRDLGLERRAKAIHLSATLDALMREGA